MKILTQISLSLLICATMIKADLRGKAELWIPIRTVEAVIQYDDDKGKINTHHASYQITNPIEFKKKLEEALECVGEK